jgi:predicted lipid-binding transport protein (Tim44 family)
MDFDDGFGRGFGWLIHWIGALVWGLGSFLLFLVVVGLIFLLVRFLLHATTAAKLYIAKNSPPATPATNATPTPRTTPAAAAPAARTTPAAAAPAARTTPAAAAPAARTTPDGTKVMPVPTTEVLPRSGRPRTPKPPAPPVG